MVRVIVGRPYAPGSNLLIVDSIFFSFNIEETYTLTTLFVDQKLSLSVYSKSTYHNFGLAGILRFVKIIEKNIGLPAI